jgi:2-amino-4-hydroxy-6-hydroxymethyldihydropteridine diphosphokinase
MMSLDDIGIVALGSNLRGVYESSLALLEEVVGRLPTAGFQIVKVSKWWRSAAWPNPTDPDYLNGVALVETALAPREALAALQELERAFGRRRGSANAPRTLDLDLIALGRAVLEGEALTLPHPRAHLRGFVMGPLAEIAPDWTHPVLGRTAKELWISASLGGDAEPAPERVSPRRRGDECANEGV